MKVKILQYSLAFRESTSGCKVKVMFATVITGNYHQAVGAYFAIFLACGLD